MLINHPGSWQQFQHRFDNKGLSVMEMKSKYLHEQYLFEAELFNLQQQHQQNVFMNGGGGGAASTSEPTPSYTTELQLTFNDNLAAVEAEFGVNPSLLSTWNAKFPNANFETIIIDDNTNPGNPTITLKGNTENAGQVADTAFKAKTTIGSIFDVNANCIIETTGTESFSQSGLVSVNLGAITKIDNSAFDSCASLTTIIMPNLTTFGPGIPDINIAAFRNCTSLSTVDFSSLVSVPNYAFYGCTSLLDLTGFRAVETVGQYSFAYSGLGDVTSDMITSIDQYGFYRAGSITSINLSSPDPISIAKSAFEKCLALDNISIVGETTLGGTNVFLEVASDGTYNFQNGYIDSNGNITYLNSIGWTSA